ncbi:MAG: hypothetical protein M1838_005481, partial [Thelocarpon superellum]
RARARLFDFRHETLPLYRQQVQSRLYRFLIDRQTQRRQRRADAKGWTPLWRHRRHRLSSRLAEDAGPARRKMTPVGTSEAGVGVGPMARTESSISLVPADGRDRGARRRKLAGYLKAANELRQTYQQSYTARGQRNESDEIDPGIPGAFPDVSIVRSGDEEMVLFPSYARRHVKKPKPAEMAPRAEPRIGPTGRPLSTADEADFWHAEWQRHEDDKAVVDVDVRGWIYAPHRGPMSRKNRLLIGLARQLSGIPAPANTPQAAGDTGQAKSSRHEQQMVEREAESIVHRGQDEAEAAERGEYSERPALDLDQISLHSQSDRHSRGSSPDTAARGLRLGPARTPRSRSKSPLASDQEDAPEAGGVDKDKRKWWNQPAEMSTEELAVANAHLMSRLGPFLTDPIVSTPVTIFFYNAETSQSRSIVTNEAGHFTIRVALDFVPTDVRVLASDTLSATQEIRITEAQGVSIISDIDDTIKHSAIGSGAKEIFRNTFIRDLHDLTIEGVREWYGRMSELGVKFHYVSNAPWQLYPVLVSYFALAGLPPGSFHLKQYSGMLQGIFEPVAERKKSTLVRIMHDFPDRKFILVGDSGEADLEVYTDIVMANPRRVLAVYIRDITTTTPHQFFDSAMGSLNGDRKQAEPIVGEKGPSEERPALPPRPSSVPSQPGKTEPPMGQLIDFGDDAPTANLSPEQGAGSDLSRSRPSQRSPGPGRPAKPPRLRSEGSGGDADHHPANDDVPDLKPAKKGPPPLPQKPRRYSGNKIAPPNVSGHGSTAPPNAPPKPLDQGPPTAAQMSLARQQNYLPSMRQKMTLAYNKLPSAATIVQTLAGEIQGPPPPPRPSESGKDRVAPSPHTWQSATNTAPPPPTPRRGLTSYPAAAAQYASSRINTAWNNAAVSSSENSSVSSPSLQAQVGAGSTNAGSTLSKKEELWKRRWARAKDVLEGKGVQLRSWHVGQDVMHHAELLVEQALKKDRHVTESRGEFGAADGKYMMQRRH